MPTIRKAFPTDAAQLAELAERTFRATFGAMNTAEDLDVHCRAHFGPMIQAAEIENQQMATLVAEEGGRLIGFAQLRFSHAATCVHGKSPGEIQRLYVEAPWHGKGLAHELMRVALDELRERGSDVAWLGVWEHNPRAIAFYRKFGFAEKGDHIFTVGRDPQRDVVMAVPI